jgi:hypothetical protein
MDRSDVPAISTHVQRELIHQQIGAFYFLFEVQSPLDGFQIA